MAEVPAVTVKTKLAELTEVGLTMVGLALSWTAGPLGADDIVGVNPVPPEAVPPPVDVVVEDCDEFAALWCGFKALKPLLQFWKTTKQQRETMQIKGNIPRLIFPPSVQILWCKSKAC